MANDGDDDVTEEERARLVTLLGEPGYTPRVRDVAGVARLYDESDEALSSLIDVAIVRAGVRAVKPLEKVFGELRPRVRARLCRVVSKSIGPEARSFLLAALKDEDPKTRRNAIIGLGLYADGEVEAALVQLFRDGAPVEQKRSIAASLGKVGGGLAAALLRGADENDAEFVRIRDRALLMLERTVGRKVASRVRLDERWRAPTPVFLYCRRGLEDFVLEDLGPAASPSIDRPGVVRAIAGGTMGDLLQVRTAISFGIPCRSQLRDEDDAESIAKAIAAEDVRALLAHFTEGPIRYRLSLAEGGHQRGLVWAIAKRVPELAPELINDPTDSTWELTVRRTPRGIAVEVAPRGFDDPRFAYRKTDVPAASHPTIAAALAQAARVRATDVVWDPFTGSGTELVECGLRAKGAKLFGSDHDPEAIARAKQNLEAAGLSATLVEQDALKWAPEGVSLIVTNPPLGRRVAREASLGSMLDGFMAHAARVLVPRGQLVWIAPFKERAEEQGRRVGLLLLSSREVDMGGFPGELQVWRK